MARDKLHPKIHSVQQRIEKSMTTPVSFPSESLSRLQTRREFIINLFVSVGAFLGLGSLAYRFAQFLYPVVPPIKLVEVSITKRGDIPVGGARLFNLPQGRVMLFNTGSELRGFSPVCTHLGCIIHWEDTVKKFVCPCHKGVFDTKGDVVSGPPPRALEKIPIAVRGDDVFAMLKIREVKV